MKTECDQCGRVKRNYNKGWTDGVLDAITELILIIPKGDREAAYEYLENFITNKQCELKSEQREKLRTESEKGEG